MATFYPAAFATRADYNFVSAYNIHKPSVDSQEYKVLGNQLITGLLDMVGNKKGVSNALYYWFEEQRLMPKIKATCSAGSTGAAVTFTVVAASDLEINQNASPYGGTPVVKYKMPVRANDLILIKPSSGTVNASSYVRAIVTSVTAPTASGNGTFSATPIDSTDTIPAVTADEIIIYGNAHGEGSAQPTGMQMEASRKSNNLQIIKDTHQITGTEKDIVLWTKIVGENGKVGYTWSLKGESAAYRRFLNLRESNLLLSDNLSSTSLSDTYATADAPLKMTKGLVPFCLGGVSQTYSSVTGFTMADAKTMVKELDKNKGSKENLLMAGIELSIQIDEELRDALTGGSITYGNFNFDSEKMVNFAFSKFKIGEYTFVKKTYDAFNDLQGMGASGYGFPFEGMVIPMDSQKDAKSGEKVPSICLRYLENPDTGESREMVVKAVSLLEVGDTGQDLFEVRYLSEIGFQGFGQERFGYISKA